LLHQPFYFFREKIFNSIHSLLPSYINTLKFLNESLKLDLPFGDYETLAGFLINQLGDLPRPGDHLQYRNLKFTVRQAEARAVKEVELVVDVLNR